jgi:hypothetical protein
MIGGQRAIEVLKGIEQSLDSAAAVGSVLPNGGMFPRCGRNVEDESDARPFARPG